LRTTIAVADLESIRKSLDGADLRYASGDMLHDDLRLMCRNAMLYNDGGTEVYRWGFGLRVGRDKKQAIRTAEQSAVLVFCL